MFGKTYDQSWHDEYSAQTLTSARRILPTVLAIGPIQSICEFGCGHGHWLAAAIEQGIVDCIGLDGEWTDRSKLLIPQKQFRSVDLGKRVDLGRQFDLAISLEVGEHISPENAKMFVKNITSSSRIALFGAAIPLQGGFKHVNEQYPSYWRALFNEAGFEAFDVIRPLHWADTSIHYYYRQNILCYIDKQSTQLIEGCRALQRRLYEEREPLDLVHPEKYELMASYGAIALKRLVPQLPRAIIQVVKRRLRS
jgi:hypothetical protein